MSALTARGVDVLDVWLELNAELRVCLVVMVYPACATREADLARLLTSLDADRIGCLFISAPLSGAPIAATNALCFLSWNPTRCMSSLVRARILGWSARDDGHVNFVFRADPALVEAFKRYFDWLWANSPAISANGVTQIPHLVLPEGTEEGATPVAGLRARTAMPQLVEDAAHAIAHVRSCTGDVTIRAQDGREADPADRGARSREAGSAG